MAANTAKGAILVTGANGGLGSAMVEQITSKPEFSAYHGLYTVRDKGTAHALTSILSSAGSTHAYDILSLDLTKLDNVRSVAEQVNTRVSAGEIPPIRALILNAGFQDFGNQSWTSDGLDTTFAANYLGQWLLTLLLLQSLDKETGQIVVVGSQAHDPNDPRNKTSQAFEDPKYKEFVSDSTSFEAIAKGEWSPASEDPTFRSSLRRYGAAKLFLIMMQHELQTRLNADSFLGKISIVGVDPGAMITGMVRRASWFIRVFLFKFVYPLMQYLNPNGSIRSTSRSAGDVLEAAFEIGEDGGPPKDRYYDGRTPLTTSEESRDPRKRKLVWNETVKLAGLREGDTVLANWQ